MTPPTSTPADTAGKSALIVGVSGQDGAYLAKLLIGKGYRVHGSSRDAELGRFDGLKALGVLDAVTLHSAAPTDFRSVLQVIARAEPDEIYNLSGQSSVGLSYQQPVETLDSIVGATLNILEALRFLGGSARFYNAGSSECFGDLAADGASETTAFRPKSPYAVAKAAAFWQVASYRESYGLHACSGILFNHESPLRPTRFVTRKIASAAARIAAGSDEQLSLGDISIERDWGWAPEYVEAMWGMLQLDAPEDFVVATGAARPLEAFVQACFAELGLDWRAHVSYDPGLRRPSEIQRGRGDAGKAARLLRWEAKTRMEAVARRMARAEKARLAGAEPDYVGDGPETATPDA